MEFLANIPGWPAYVISLLIGFLYVKEKMSKVKNDAILNRKSALELVQQEVKALGELVERKDREHREDLKEREAQWRATMERKDLEHQAASKENTILIKNLERDLAVYKAENKQKDDKIKELKELLQDRNPKIETILVELSSGLADIYKFMKLYVGDKKVSELPIK